MRCEHSKDRTHKCNIFWPVSTWGMAWTGPGKAVWLCVASGCFVLFPWVMHPVLPHTVLRHNSQFHRGACRSKGVSVEVFLLCARHKQHSTYYFLALLQSLPVETAVISGSIRFYHRTILDVGVSTRSGLRSWHWVVFCNAWKAVLNSDQSMREETSQDPLL